MLTQYRNTGSSEAVSLAMVTSLVNAPSATPTRSSTPPWDVIIERVRSATILKDTYCKASLRSVITPVGKCEISEFQHSSSEIITNLAEPNATAERHLLTSSQKLHTRTMRTINGRPNLRGGNGLWTYHSSRQLLILLPPQILERVPHLGKNGVAFLQPGDSVQIWSMGSGLDRAPWIGSWGLRGVTN